MICENCGKEHDGTYGSGRFCSKECARSYSSKNTTGLLKKAKCIDCGKIIYIGKRSLINNCRCDICKKNHKMVKCSICGSLYHSNEGCLNKFCKNHNLLHIKTLIKYFGFDKKKLGTKEVENEYNRIKNILYNLYWKEEKSFADISKIYNYNGNPGNLTKIFEHLEIPRRTFSETSILTYLQGKQDNKECENQYHQQWHTTWNGKEVYLRSSYELDYAKELDEQQIDYEIEYFHIKYWDSQKQEYRCAIPDFYIPITNTIIEIKSSWTLDKQNMKDKMKAYKDLGYNFKLICDHNEKIL